MARITTPEDFVRQYEIHGSVKAVHRATGTPYGTTQRLYYRAVAAKLMEPLPIGGKRREHRIAVQRGQLSVKKPNKKGAVSKVRVTPLPLKKGKVTRFLFTSAQNNTDLHEGFWKNLLALKKHYDAELFVSFFSYLKNGLGARGDKAEWMQEVISGKRKSPGVHEVMKFDPRLLPFENHEARRAAKGIQWMGEQNILPTAARPLSGFESITGRDSCVVPHPRIAMESVATAKSEATKLMYTTGAVTKRNYIMRKEGRKADFHHSFGALLVEVDADQNWWARQIVGDDDGTIYEVDPKGNGCLRVHGGKVTSGHRALAIVWGDIHTNQMDKTVRKLAFGKGGMLDKLRPKYQFFHDTLDFQGRNRHDIDDEFTMLLRHATRTDNVSVETKGCADFFDEADRPWCQSVVVNSNHDRAMMGWLRDSKAKNDPVNMRFRAVMRAKLAEATELGRTFIAFREAYLYVTGRTAVPPRLRFLDEDESFILEGIEFGMHGDRGPNGARGSRVSISRMGRKSVIGHSHSAGITDGCWQTGCCEIMYPDYVKGPSSWTHTHCLVYPNGKRALVTMFAGKWRA